MITRNRFVGPEWEPVRFEAADMRFVGEVATAAMHERIGRGVTVADAPARPLSSAYAKAKVRRGLPPIRDYKFSGEFLAGLGVSGAADGSVTIGPAVQGVKAAALARANARDEMVGLSAGDQARVEQALAEQYKLKSESRSRRVERGKWSLDR